MIFPRAPRAIGRFWTGLGFPCCSFTSFSSSAFGLSTTCLLKLKATGGYGLECRALSREARRETGGATHLSFAHAWPAVPSPALLRSLSLPACQPAHTI